MNRPLVLALLLVVSIVGGGLLVLAEQQNHYDPLAEFRSPDGKLSFPGGKLTKELQNLLFPPPPPKDYTTYLIDFKSSRPTMEIKGETHLYPVSVKTYSYADSLEAGSSAFTSMWRGLQSAWKEFSNFAESLSPFETASATNCASAAGSCFWIAGTGNFSDGTHWSETTGGAACACTPSTTSTVTFDASSGAGTATQNNATFTSGAATMTASSVTVSGSNNTWKVGGNWSDANAHFSPATSTIEFTATATIANTNNATEFFNATIDSGVTVNISVGINFTGTFTINNGTLNSTATTTGRVLSNSTTTSTPFSFTTPTFTGGGVIGMNNNTVNNAVFAGANYGNWRIDLRAATTVTYLIGGTITTTGTILVFPDTSGILTVNTQNNSITTTSDLRVSADGAGTSSNMIMGSSTVSVTNAVIATAQAAGYLNMGSSTWTVTGTWTNGTTSASWSAGTGTVTFTSATGGTMTFAGANIAAAEFNNVTFTSSAGTAQTFTMATRGIRWLSTLSITDSSSTTTLATANLSLGNSADTPDLSIGNSGILTANASVVQPQSVTMTGGTSGTLTVTTGQWTTSGNWNTSGAGSTFSEGTTSSYQFNGTGTTTLLSTDNTFTTVIVLAGTRTLGSAVVIDRVLTVSGGTLAKNTQTLTITNSQAATDGLLLSGGDLTSTSGDVSVTGAVNISSASSAITLGSENWTVTGAWTNASTDGTVWDAGTGTVAFNAGVSQTMTFAGANLSEAEFNNVTFNSTAGMTYAMGTRGVRWLTTLSVTDTATTVALVTNGFTFGNAADTPDVNVGLNGTLTTTTSTVSIQNMTMTSATSGTTTITSGTWTVAGNWNTSGVGTTFTAGTSTVTMNGTAKTVALRNSSNGFNNLTVSGTVTANSFVWANATLLVSGTLTKTGQSIVFVTLTATTGTIVDGAISVTNFSVSNSATNQTTISVFTTWTTNSTYKWTDTIAAGTDTFTITGITQTKFNVLKDGAPFITGGTVVANTVTFTMTSGDPVVEVDLFSSVTCTTYFWVGGTGVWSDFATHWVSTSGGTTPCDAYPNTSTSNVVFDANSGVGTVTVDVNPTIGSMTLGGSITLSAGTHTITVNGNWTRTSTFTAGTSTIVFAATALIASTMDGANAFYNLTINLGATVTTTNSGQSSIEVNNVLTVNGTLDFTGNTAFRVLHLNNVASTSNPLVMGASGLITSSEAEGGGPNDSLLSFADLSSFANNPATVNIPAGKYYNIAFEIGGKAGGGTINYQATGTWATNTNPLTGKTDKGAYVWMNSVNGALTLTTGANTINVSGIQNSAGANAEGVLSNGGTVNLIASATGYAHQALGGGGSGYGTCNCPMPVNFYIQFGTGIWNVDGDWSSISTSANWSAGTGTINFTSNTASGYTVQHIGDATGTKNIFYTFTASGTASKLLSTPLTASNSFTLTSTTFDTASNTLTLGAVTLASGGILVANASVITVSGNWNSSAGTFTFGTSSVTFTASNTLTTANGQAFYNLTINTGITTTNSSTGSTVIRNVFTVNGAVDMGNSNRFFRFDDVLGSTDPLVFGPSGSITGVNSTSSGGLNFAPTAGTLINIPAKVYTGMRLLMNVTIVVAGDGYEFRLAGNATFNSIEPFTGNAGFFNSQTFNVTINGGRADNDLRIDATVFGIKVTSGTWSILGGVFLTSAGQYIQFGTSAWTVGKNYTSASTSASWNQGTATLHFTGASQTYSQGAEPLYDITFDSGANYVVSGSVYTKNLHVVGTMTMNGFAVTAFDMTTNVGLMNIDIWQKFNRGSATDVRWHFNPDTATTTITIMQGGVQPLTTYSLYRDGTDIQQSLSDGSGKVTFSVAGGWSPHSMVIAPPGGVPPTPGGGGGGGSGTTNPTWDWEVIGDWTVRFTVTTKVEGATYEWILTGKVIGSGEEFVYSFPRTGVYDVTMRASRDGAVFSETTKTVTVAALSFFAMNFVVLVLIVIGAVFIVMTPGYKSAIGKLVSFIAGAAFLFGALQLSSQNYASPSYTSPAGIEIIGGAALLIGAAFVGRKSKGFALLMFLAGLGLVLYAISTLF